MARRRKPVPDEGVRFYDPVKLPLPAIQFAPYNPRTITDEEMTSLKASLIEHGMVLNLVVQKKGDDGTPLVLIGGHQRVRAARALCDERGWQLPEDVWCTVLDVPDREAKKLNVALNKISGEFDPFKLGALFSDIPDMTDFEVIGTGFRPGEVDELVRLILDPDAQADALEASIGQLDGFAHAVTLTVEFDTVERRDRVKELLREMAIREGCKPGELIDKAVGVLVARGPKRRRRRRALS